MMRCGVDARYLKGFFRLGQRDFEARHSDMLRRHAKQARMASGSDSDDEGSDEISSSYTGDSSTGSSSLLVRGGGGVVVVVVVVVAVVVVVVGLVAVRPSHKRTK